MNGCAADGGVNPATTNTFTVATSRGIRAAVAPLEEAHPKLPIIALGGAVVAYADGSLSFASWG